MKITSLKNPTWVDEDNINCIATFEQLGGEEIPFTASKNDVMPYGVEIFNRLISGEFGAIAPTEPQIALPTESSGNTGVTVL